MDTRASLRGLRVAGSGLERAWLGACIAGYLLLCWLVRSFTTDDAWISARYAENIANGHGFVWNPGGPRAEGFSNPGLVGVEAIAHLVGFSAVGTARAIGVASGIALLLVLHRLGPAVVGPRAARLAMALTAFYPPLALWSVGGLETMPVVLVLTTGALLLARPGADRRTALRAGAVLAVLPWLRPEGLVVALAMVAAAEAGSLLLPGDRREAARRVALAAAPVVAAQVVLEAFRLLVYGHWLPNSVVYKSGSGESFAVLEKFIEQAIPVLAVAALGLLLARRRQLVLAVPPAIYALGSEGMLDSVNSFSRFLLPVWPHLALLAGIAVAAASRLSGRASVAVAAVATAIAVLVVAAPDADVEAVRSFSSKYASCKEAARTDAAAWLRTNTPAGASFSVSDAGLVPAQGGGRAAVDQFMLNEPAIQETGPVNGLAKADFVFARRPTVIVLVSRSAARFAWRYFTDRSISSDPRFRRYSLAHVARGEPAACTYHLFLYKRRGTGPGRHSP